MHARLTTRPHRSETVTFDLNGITNAGSTSAVGYTISGINPGDRVELTPYAGLYTAWREQPATNWRCRLKVEDGNGTITDHYTTASSGVSAAAALALATAEGPVILETTGPYKVWLPDSVTADNVGGMSISALIRRA